MKLQNIVAAVALLAAGAAHAGVDAFNAGATSSTGGNSSLMLVMLDSTGPTTRGLTIDLGYNFTDFNSTGAFTQANQSITWDLAGNAVTANGAAALVGLNSWSSPLASFLSIANGSEVRWAVLAGSMTSSSSPRAFLATGNPTTAQLGNQGAQQTAGLIGPNSLLTSSNTRGTHATATNGAYDMGSSDAGYVGLGSEYGPTTTTGWETNLRWSSWTALGGKTNLTQAVNNGTEIRLGDPATFAGGLTAYDTPENQAKLLNLLGTFALSADGTTLTWQTAAVPEPSTYGMALVGLLAVGYAVRRRAA